MNKCVNRIFIESGVEIDFSRLVNELKSEGDILTLDFNKIIPVTDEHNNSKEVAWGTSNTLSKICIRHVNFTYRNEENHDKYLGVICFETVEQEPNKELIIKLIEFVSDLTQTPKTNITYNFYNKGSKTEGEYYLSDTNILETPTNLLFPLLNKVYLDDMESRVNYEYDNILNKLVTNKLIDNIPESQLDILFAIDDQGYINGYLYEFDKTNYNSINVFDGLTFYYSDDIIKNIIKKYEHLCIEFIDGSIVCISTLNKNYIDMCKKYNVTENINDFICISKSYRSFTATNITDAVLYVEVCNENENLFKERFMHTKFIYNQGINDFTMYLGISDNPISDLFEVDILKPFDKEAYHKLMYSLDIDMHTDNKFDFINFIKTYKIPKEEIDWLLDHHDWVNDKDIKYFIENYQSE